MKIILLFFITSLLIFNLSLAIDEEIASVGILGDIIKVGGSLTNTTDILTSTNLGKQQTDIAETNSNNSPVEEDFPTQETELDNTIENNSDNSDQNFEKLKNSYDSYYNHNNQPNQELYNRKTESNNQEQSGKTNWLQTAALIVSIIVGLGFLFLLISTFFPKEGSQSAKNSKNNCNQGRPQLGYISDNLEDQFERKLFDRKKQLTREIARYKEEKNKLNTLKRDKKTIKELPKIDNIDYYSITVQEELPTASNLTKY